MLGFPWGINGLGMPNPYDGLGFPWSKIRGLFFHGLPTMKGF